MSKYQWRGGYRASVSAEVAGVELARIESRDGNLTPSVVVEEAKPEDAPLHPAFEWSNRKAAQLYRESQARHLIRSVHVVAETDSESEQTPVYVHVERGEGEDAERCYVTTVNALSDDALRKQVLDRARADLESFQRRYAHLEELSNVIIAARTFLQTA